MCFDQTAWPPARLEPGVPTGAARCARPPAARGLLREREERLAALNRKAMALPPGRGGYTQQQQAAAWRGYLAWEQGNPQHLDEATYAARWGGGPARKGRRALAATGQIMEVGSGCSCGFWHAPPL